MILVTGRRILLDKLCSNINQRERFNLHLLLCTVHCILYTGTYNPTWIKLYSPSHIFLTCLKKYSVCLWHSSGYFHVHKYSYLVNFVKHSVTLSCSTLFMYRSYAVPQVRLNYTARKAEVKLVLNNYDHNIFLQNSSFVELEMMLNSFSWSSTLEFYYVEKFLLRFILNAGIYYY